MDIATDSGAALYVRGFGGRNRWFSLLSVRGLGELARTMDWPPGEARYVSPFDLARYAKTPEGSAATLRLSAREQADQVERWGSVAQRCGLAARIVAASLMTGEEQPREDANAPVPFARRRTRIGWRWPFASPTTAQALAIRST